MFYNQSTNSPINQLTHNNEYRCSKIDKLINKFTNSPINLLHRARKNNKNMQNEPNFLNAQIDISACIRSGYDIFSNFSCPKNEPKRTQNEPKLQNDEMSVTTYITKEYEIFRPFSSRKNKAKRTQNEPNFSLKLGSFFQILALFPPISSIFLYLLTDRMYSYRLFKYIRKQSIFEKFTGERENGL